MQYQLKEWKQNGSLKINGDGTSTQPIMVWTKVVGDTYGFEKTDATDVTIPSGTTLPDGAVSVCDAAAAAFVAAKYPNT